MIDPVTLNARNPRDNVYGYAMLERMNERHSTLHQWALEHISLENTADILDIGFGGGQNIKNLHHLVPEAKICGIDYSEASYKKCAEINKEAIQNGAVRIEVGSADNLPYAAQSFDLVTAFETTYYWPNIETCFRNVYNCLKENGVFLICNEDCTLEGNEEIAETLDMKFYDIPELEKLLYQAGFKTVRTDRHFKGRWVCAVGIR